MLSWDFCFPFLCACGTFWFAENLWLQLGLGFSDHLWSRIVHSGISELLPVFSLWAEQIFFFNHFNINALTNYRFRLWLTKLLVIESSIYPKVVVPRTWILLSFWFYFGFFLPHYFHSSFQRSCYTQPAKGNSLLKRSVSYKYITDLFITYWRI